MSFAPGSDWESDLDFEPAQPDHHIGGGGDPAILSVGFGPVFTTDLGDPPLHATGAPDFDYGGTIDQRYQAIRAMPADGPAIGGARWCLFFGRPTPPEVSFATRVSAIIPAGAEMGSLEDHLGPGHELGGLPAAGLSIGPGFACQQRRSRLGHVPERWDTSPSTRISSS